MWAIRLPHMRQQETESYGQKECPSFLQLLRAAKIVYISASIFGECLVFFLRTGIGDTVPSKV
jgi:hypothetical protein